MGKDFIVSPGLDNRVGLFVAMEAFRLCARAKLPVGILESANIKADQNAEGDDDDVDVEPFPSHGSDGMPAPFMFDVSTERLFEELEPLAVPILPLNDREFTLSCFLLAPSSSFSFFCVVVTFGISDVLARIRSP